jgi:hypothetical protein
MPSWRRWHQPGERPVPPVSPKAKAEIVNWQFLLKIVLEAASKALQIS